MENNISENEIAVITAAVHLYLNNGQIKELNNHRVSANGYPVIKVARPKCNKWKWSFFPHVNKQGLRDYRWLN